MDKFTVGMRFDNLYKHFKNAELMTPTQLAGISEITEPNTMWASFSAAQDSLVYDPNALGSFTEYMKEAANVVSYNPVIISLTVNQGYSRHCTGQTAQ